MSTTSEFGQCESCKRVNGIFRAGCDSVRSTIPPATSGPRLMPCRARMVPFVCEKSTRNSIAPAQEPSTTDANSSRNVLGVHISHLLLELFNKRVRRQGRERSADQFLVIAGKDALAGVGRRHPGHFLLAILTRGIEQMKATELLIARSGESRKEQISTVGEEEDTSNAWNGSHVDAGS